MVCQALQGARGYQVQSQVNVGLRSIGGTKHIVDFVVTRADRRFLVSVKWQGTSGTGEDKVPFEVISLADALTHDKTLSVAYLVIGGDGWTQSKKDYYVGGKLKHRIFGTERVRCVTLDVFLGMMHRGEL